MSEPPDGGPSFDPRTWLSLPGDKQAAPGQAPSAPPGQAPGPPPGQAPSQPTAPPGPGQTSFDPKSWRADAPAATAAPPPRKGGAPVVAIVAGVVVVALAAGGAVLFWPKGHGHKPAAASAASAAPAPAGSTRSSLVVGGPADLTGALTGAGVAPDEAAQAAKAAQGQLGAASGSLHVTLILQPSGSATHLVSLEARRDDGAGVMVTSSGGGFQAAAAAANLTSTVRVISGEMDANSFYSSAVAAGIPDTLISPFAQAFTFDFDFEREIKPGDRFEAAFEQKVNEHGDVVGVGQLIYVSMVTEAKQAALYHYQPPSGEAGWYDGNGRSIVRSLMRTPVEGARISSPFGLRMHPVQGFVKMHNGTDFAAPVGTPIYASGDGVVEEVSPLKGPNGNFTKIRHDNGWETLYLHQSAFAPGLVQGMRVHQGQQIGMVGATGVDRFGKSTVTGPHLHYELHINGVPVDAMTQPMEKGQVLSGETLKAFFKERNRIDTQRQQQSG